MHIRFLLGPAGSGKTFRCLAEIRDALCAEPEGPPLLLLAPKQATFQLERQLLADPALPGYTRLQILSFDRLADFVLGEFAASATGMLQEAGRVMVLRALLARHQSKLKIFHATARLPGFAQQLNLLLREFQRQQISPRQLAGLAEQTRAQSTLSGKLHDAALLLNAYLDWLRAQGLQDADNLLEAATEALKEVRGEKGEVRSAKLEGRRAKDEVSGDAPNVDLPALTSHLSPLTSTQPLALRPSHFGLHLDGLWLDGFAEMTPQELDLLGAFLPICRRATLAFCTDTEAPETVSWLSGWSVVNQTFRECHQRATALPGAEVVVETLPRHPDQNRFAGSPVLQQLEKNWAASFTSQPTSIDTVLSSSHLSPLTSHLSLVVCSNPETEAILAAREILRFVRRGGRFREAAVLLRHLDHYDAPLRRVFRRYDIPFFLDRREPVSHHPLAELTRCALRLAAFGWQHDDWFGALKTGLATHDEAAVDRLENEALARGWQGNVWLQPIKLSDDAALERSLNRFLQELLPPFLRWTEALNASSRRPAARELAAALRELWKQLDVGKTLERWSTNLPAQAAIHLSVLEQLNAWLDNVELAFGDQAWPLAEWLPILETGLTNLTVGIIPPALDQVLIGAIDRSRNPELRLAVLPGWNETIFPAPPPPGALLTETERDLLAGRNVRLGLDRRQQIGQERYYAYIACTRARERLVITAAAQTAEGQPLNPSPFFDRVQQLTGAGIETFDGAADWRESEHVYELAAPVLRAHSAPSPEPALLRLSELPALAQLVERWREITAAAVTRLTAGGAEKLYGRELPTSVSGLEDFAACPFRFFAARGLRLQERKEFQFDDRDKGSFQHEVLCEFHRRIRNSGRRWRDLDIPEARRLVQDIGRELLPVFGGGRFLADGAARFTGDLLIERLGRLVTALIGWLAQYRFEAELVELGFGLDPDGLPAWRIELPDGRALRLRGRIDRVDLCRSGDETFAVVMDYKSSVRALNPLKLHHGLELQLLSYLGVLRHLAEPEKFFAARRLTPAGVFYVPLNGGGGGSGKTRYDVLADSEAARRAAYQHSGRFLADALAHFDNRGVARGDQFKYSKNKGGEFSARGNEALPAAEFAALAEKIEGHLRDYGRRIFAGEVDVSPFRIGRETACDWCDFRALCRFDPWTQPFRELRPPPKMPRELPASGSKARSTPSE